MAAASGPTADLAAVLEESVAAHLVADVPVASFLSGGLDSSLITAMARTASRPSRPTPLPSVPEDQRLEAMPDDARYARKMAAHLGIRLHEIEISPDVVDMLPRIVDVLDEPIGDPAAINTVLMCQAAREAGVKVLLSGMGADELFGGYRKHLACVLAPDTRRCRDRCVRGWWRRASTNFRWQPAGAAFGTADGPSASSASLTCRRRRHSAAATPSTTTTSSPRCSIPTWNPGARLMEAHRSLYTDNNLSDHVNRMCLADTRLFLPDSTWPTPTAPAWRRRARCAYPSSTPMSSGLRSPSAAVSKSRDGTQKAPLRDAAEDWLPGR